MDQATGGLQDTREQRLEYHCLDLAQSLLNAHYMKDVYLKCTDEMCVPVHKFVLGAQSECAPRRAPACMALCTTLTACLRQDSAQLALHKMKQQYCTLCA